jgi:hypothetical protein
MCHKLCLARRRFLLPFALLALSACFHTTVSTGVAPAPGEVRKEWAAGWLWGLIGPAKVRADAACQHGISTVDTEHSFLNQVASFFTMGIYAPMSIRIRCAAAPRQP